MDYTACLESQVRGLMAMPRIASTFISTSIYPAISMRYSTGAFCCTEVQYAPSGVPHCAAPKSFCRRPECALLSYKVRDELIVDMAHDGTVYGIELQNANEQLQRGDMGKLLVANEATGEQVEVPLSIQ